MIQLEYFTRNDFQQLIDWINTEELLMNWSGRMFLFPLTEDSLEWYIKDTNHGNESDAFVYKAVDETGKAVGHISLGGISPTNKNARISRVFVSPDARGRSICQQMVEAVLKIGFQQLKLHRIALGAYDSNKAAIKCYEKAGMKIEGINRDIFLYNGQYWGMVEMAMLEDEWQTLQAK